MEIHLKTLTPLWTGGVDGTCDRLHETGIIGSLRWWYEAIVRGLGGWACDPTTHTCNFNKEHYETAVRQAKDEREALHDAGLCDACQVFGATGWRRQFRLRVENGTPLFAAERIPLPSGRTHPIPRTGTLRAGGWYLQGEARVGGGDGLRLKIASLTREDVTPLLLTPLTLIHRQASLGAKVSNGYGVPHLTHEDGMPIAVSRTQLDRLPAGQRPAADLPDLRDYFFAKLTFQEPPRNPDWWQRIKGIAEAWVGQVTDQGHAVHIFVNRQKHWEAQHDLRGSVRQGLLPLAPAVRNWLRYIWDTGLTEPQKNFLFGTTSTLCPRCYASPDGRFKEDRYNAQDYWCPSCRTTFPKGKEVQRAASKINVTHAYRRDDGQWEFRLWGWVPCQAPDQLNLPRDAFLDQLHRALTLHGEWAQVFGQPIVPSLEWYALDCTNRGGRGYLERLLGLVTGGAQ